MTSRRAFLSTCAATSAALAQQTQKGSMKGASGTPQLYTLKSDKIEASITNYGGIVTKLLVPDRNGKMGDVVLGFDTPTEYITKNTPYFGALIGRYGNRIGNAHFKLEGKEYRLPKNDSDNTLHGGLKGFDKRYWQVGQHGADKLVLTYTSADGEEGFPGTLKATVTYTAIPGGLRIEYVATTDKPTVLNLTNHSYFNLAGQGNGTVLNHEIMINADRFTPVDKGLIPTGELKSVVGTPFDFQNAHKIGERIDASNEQIQFGKGYDHNWVLNRQGSGLSLVARVAEPTTGRVLEVHSTEPAVQFYTGNFLDGSVKGKGGKAYMYRGAFCLETQHYPDSPNHANFPTTELKPGQTYRTTTEFRFSAK